MVKAEELGYEKEELGNISIADIKKAYSDGIIIWLTGSGASPTSKYSRYSSLMEYKGHTKYFEGTIESNSPNRAMIRGAIVAASNISKTMHVYIIAPTTLGYLNAFKGKGDNGELLQELFSILKERKCSLTETVISSGGDMIKQYIKSQNSEELSKHSEVENASIANGQKQNGNAYQLTEKQKRFKQIVYKECLSKVKVILEKYGANEKMINEIMNVTFEE